MNYFESLLEAMTWLSQKENTYFMGQAVGCAGTGMSNTLKNVDIYKRCELPVAEEFQMGMSLGMSLEGFVPISIYPRWNFLLCAMNQLINHVDKYSLMSDYRPKVIIRVGIGSINPLDPQDMHKGDFTDAIANMCKTIKVKKLMKAEDIVPAYQEAYFADHSTILVEVSDFLNQEFYERYNRGEVEDKFNPLKA